MDHTHCHTYTYTRKTRTDNEAIIALLGEFKEASRVGKYSIIDMNGSDIVGTDKRLSVFVTEYFPHHLVNKHSGVAEQSKLCVIQWNQLCGAVNKETTS